MIFSYLAALLCLTITGEAQRSFTSHTECVNPVISIVSSDQRGSFVTAGNAMTRSLVEKDANGRNNYWLTPDGAAGNLIGDLSCVAAISGVELVNTHEAAKRRYSTKGFTVSFSTSSAGPWNVAASGELEDSRQQEDPLPLQTFTFNPISARFVKFEITSFYGTGGGLQYFNVVVYKNVKTRRIEICSSDIGEHVFCRYLHTITLHIF